MTFGGSVRTRTRRSAGRRFRRFLTPLRRSGQKHRFDGVFHLSFDYFAHRFVAAGETFENALLLAGGGKAHQPIVVSPNASGGMKAVANELAGYLQRITGAEFEVEVGDGSRGVVLETIGTVVR